MKVCSKYLGLILVMCLSMLSMIACGQQGVTSSLGSEEVTAAVEYYISSSEDLPLGCLSCHREFNDSADLSLAAILSDLQEQQRHPAAPEQCLMCHQEDGALPLAAKLHSTHYLEGCVQCHKLNSEGDFKAMLLEPSQPSFKEVKASSEDLAPGGCGDCHKQSEQGDYSLAVILNETGHPPMQDGATVDQCVGCHQGGQLALGKLMHQAHYDTEEDTYTQVYGGSCRNCHNVDNAFKMSVKGLAN